MSNRNTRRTLTMAAIVLVVLAAVGIGFYRIGRSTATPPTIPLTPGTTATGPTPTYAPTDQYGSPEPGLPVGPAIAGQGGTKTGPAGLPLGYAHDQTGAVNAATNYLSWMNSIRIADKSTADAMAANSAADQRTEIALVSSFDELRTGMTNLTADQPEPARGAYAIAKYTQEAAVVYIWSPEVITDATRKTQQLWGINAINVVWVSGDWKLKDDLVAKIGGAAVDPLDPAGNPSAAEKHSILGRTPADAGEIHDSADQTWFEYANAPH